MAGGRENLIPASTKDEARRRGRNGGIASGKARRKRKTLRELFGIIADSQVTGDNTRAALQSAGITGDDATNAAALAFRIMGDAIKGNPRMAQMALDLLGESAPRRVELTGAKGGPVQIEANPLEGLTIDEIRKLAGMD